MGCQNTHSKSECKKVLINWAPTILFLGCARSGGRTSLQVQSPESASTSRLEVDEEENSELSIGPTHRSRQELWKYFERIDENTNQLDRENRKAKCNLCRSDLRTKNGITTSLLVHLRAHHPEQYLMYAEKREQNLRAIKERSKTPKINSAPFKGDLAKQLAFDLELTKMLVMTNSPFTFADNPWFKRFISTLDPGLTVKNTCNAFQTNLKILCSNTKEAVDEILRKDLPQVIIIVVWLCFFNT